jgi:hypothetical protein
MFEFFFSTALRQPIWLLVRCSMWLLTFVIAQLVACSIMATISIGRTSSAATSCCTRTHSPSSSIKVDPTRKPNFVFG